MVIRFSNEIGVVGILDAMAATPLLTVEPAPTVRAEAERELELVERDMPEVADIDGEVDIG